MAHTRTPAWSLGDPRMTQIADGTLVRACSPRPGCVSAERPASKLGPHDVVKRIRWWRDLASLSGWYPTAVAALDHYLENTGTFVEIPAGKVEAVRASSEKKHLHELCDRLVRKKVALFQAAAEWHEKGVFTSGDHRLRPEQIDATVVFASGTEEPGLTDDNLTYYGSMIHSEVVVTVRQASIPRDRSTDSFDLELAIRSWRSWVVDNYDWEGDKQFGIFAKLGLPSQKEMNSLQKAGIAKAYQRSSRSWQPEHGIAPWKERAGSFEALQDAGFHRLEKNKADAETRARDLREGMLPTPRPAEELLR